MGLSMLRCTSVMVSSDFQATVFRSPLHTVKTDDRCVNSWSVSMGVLMDRSHVTQGSLTHCMCTHLSRDH